MGKTGGTRETGTRGEVVTVLKLAGDAGVPGVCARENINVAAPPARFRLDWQVS